MLLFFDTETGGIDFRKYDLLTASFTVTDIEGEVKDGLDLLLRPDGRDISTSDIALQMNHIDIATHGQEAMTYEQGAMRLQEFLFNNSRDEILIPVGWNVAFDIDFITEYLLKQSAWGTCVSYRAIDLQSVNRWLNLVGKISTGGSLSDCANYFGIDTTLRHEARRDTELVIEIYKSLKKVEF